MAYVVNSPYFMQGDQYALGGFGQFRGPVPSNALMPGTGLTVSRNTAVPTTIQSNVGTISKADGTAETSCPTCEEQGCIDPASCPSGEEMSCEDRGYIIPEACPVTEDGVSCEDRGYIPPSACPACEGKGLSWWWLLVAAGAGIGIGFAAGKKL